MKILSKIISLAVLLLIVGCSTPNTTAYRSIGALAVSVNTSLKVYNEFYQAGKSSEEDREKVKAAYEKYQTLARVASKLERGVNSAPQGLNNYQIAGISVASAAQEIINLIQQLTTK